jgi:hypothetical protein
VTLIKDPIKSLVTKPLTIICGIWYSLILVLGMRWKCQISLMLWTIWPPEEGTAVCTAQKTGSPRFVRKKSKIPASAFEQSSCRLQLASLWYYSSPSSRILCTYQTSDTSFADLLVRHTWNIFLVATSTWLCTSTMMGQLHIAIGHDGYVTQKTIYHYCKSWNLFWNFPISDDGLQRCYCVLFWTWAPNNLASHPWPPSSQYQLL